MSSRTTPGSMGRYTLSQSESASSDLAGGADRRETEIVVVCDTNSLRLREEEEDCWRERLWEVKCKAEFGNLVGEAEKSWGMREFKDGFSMITGCVPI
jgi:hypothetical protein